jgi:hypothetical protein
VAKKLVRRPFRRHPAVEVGDGDTGHRRRRRGGEYLKPVPQQDNHIGPGFCKIRCKADDSGPMALDMPGF